MNYPRIPTLDPRAQGEDVQGYGLRALLFVMATDCTGGVDDEGLELAHYVFPLAVSARDLSTSAAERLATTQRRISLALQGRKAEQAERLAALQAPSAAADSDRPSGGQVARLTPEPVAPVAPGGVALQAPAPVTADVLRDPRRIAAALTVPAAQAPRPSAPAPVVAQAPAPRAPQAPAPRQPFVPVLRPVARPSAPAAPAADWGF